MTRIFVVWWNDNDPWDHGCTFYGDLTAALNFKERMEAEGYKVEIWKGQQIVI